MKLFTFLSAILFLFISADKCGSRNDKVISYKGRLEIKAQCMNYTLSLVEENPDTSLVTSSWTDEATGKSYKNVFGLVNPCDFPVSIAEGDEFTFVIDSAGTRICPVCLAYYPTPPKKLWVKVIN